MPLIRPNINSHDCSCYQRSLIRLYGCSKRRYHELLIVRMRDEKMLYIGSIIRLREDNSYTCTYTIHRLRAVSCRRFHEAKTALHLLFPLYKFGGPISAFLFVKASVIVP